DGGAGVGGTNTATSLLAASATYNVPALAAPGNVNVGSNANPVPLLSVPKMSVALQPAFREGVHGDAPDSSTFPDESKSNSATLPPASTYRFPDAGSIATSVAPPTSPPSPDTVAMSFPVLEISSTLKSPLTLNKFPDGSTASPSRLMPRT